MKIHTKENNAESEKHLRLYRRHFTRDAANVCYMFMQGQELTVSFSMARGYTGDLRRRVKDLRDWGIDVSDRWVTSLSTGRKYKSYYMEKPAIKAAKKLLTKKNK